MADEKAAQWVAISKLAKWTENPRRNEAAIDKVAVSIQRFGFASPIVARKEDGQIICGHTRLLAAQQLGLKVVPVRYMDLDPADAKLLALADNKLGEIAEWDQLLLKDIFESEDFDLADLNISGFDFDAMSDILGDSPDVDDEEPDIIEERTEYDDIPRNIEPTINAGDDIQIGRHRMICGECVEVMRTFEDNSIDCIVCDPPYSISFMNKQWDTSGPTSEWAAECFRILKPGGHLIAFAATRTFHRLGMVVEQANFEVRDTINWLYFSGFPKSHSVSKGIDSHFGAEREVIGSKPNQMSGWNMDGSAKFVDRDITAPSTPEAKQFDGYGSALKPAFEPAILARKPLSEKTLALNALRWGTGGLNIDGSRFGYGDPCWVGPNEKPDPMTISSKGMMQGLAGKTGKEYQLTPSEIGRWPANIFQCPKASRSEREENIHPTVKPIKLMRWLCRLVMPPTDHAVILDTFAGSGSTLVAAEFEDFASIGIEMMPEYCDIIKARLERAIDGQTDKA